MASIGLAGPWLTTRPACYHQPVAIPTGAKRETCTLQNLIGVYRGSAVPRLMHGSGRRDGCQGHPARFTKDDTQVSRSRRNSPGKLPHFPDISCIIPPIIHRSLADEGQPSEDIVGEELCKSFLTNAAHTNMLVAVKTTAELTL